MSSSGDDKMPAPPPTCEFKKPPALLTVGKVGGKKKFRAPEPPKLNTPPITIAKENSTLLEKKEGKDQSLVPVPMVKLKQTTLSIGPDSQDGKILYPAQKCPYDEPSWGGRPEVDFRLSVLKNGTIIGSEKLAKSFFVVGRHQDCDLIMEHPSISRFHAVLQYRKPHPDATDPEKRLGGFYLFDLGSTHGTQLNRQPVDAKSYRRVRVGHHIKFGFSTRAFILEGPAEDEEAESELSVTEIIELRKKREAEWKLMREAERVSKEEAARKRDEEDRDAGINWGMAEDATEEDEECPTMSDVNPFAFGTAENVDEQLYLDDPKKTLRGWFEREGYELEYHVEEKGPQQFICRVKLPIDVGSGSAVIAEACVKGRKKEAVVQCAMEACRILDRHGELRKAHHDSRAKKNLKNWKEDDYYDSDEDEFFDRTGDLVTKREQRKARLEHKGQTVETYESLKEKLAITENAIREINESLEKSKAVEAASKASGDGGDSLESFMKQLKAGTALDKAKRSQLRLDHARLTAEQIRLIRLVNIAKPTELPPLKAMSIDAR
ncbi:kanadaptin-like isoform X2 [Varroa jacobsoni]|uniref:kanadaptin-like isoform X2 n=1 Tax=Varroa jacobsoni TaxID=62625 RepID=UPI000BF9AA64|nr:kanadaptin-like isoform X2 [Varroa jacobsoni]